jgi:hypothetical protein
MEAHREYFGSDVQCNISSVVLYAHSKDKNSPYICSVSRYIEIFIETSWGDFREERYKGHDPIIYACTKQKTNTLLLKQI